MSCEQICRIERATSTSRTPRSSRARGSATGRNGRLQRWSASGGPADKEVYHTVVVNYRYSAEQLHHPSTAQLKYNKQEARNNNKKLIAKAYEEDDDYVPNLSKLYEEEQEPHVELEVYHALSSEPAVIEQIKVLPTPSPDYAEVIVISDSEDEKNYIAPPPNKLVKDDLARKAQKERTKLTSPSAPKQKTKSGPTLKQHQLELHRQRLAVEQKRLELLEVKLTRERDEMLFEKILFEKELELKTTQMKQMLMDKDDAL